MPFLGHSWIVLLILLVIVLVVAGPGKLSHLGGAIGRSVRDFRRETREPDSPKSKAPGTD